MYLFTFRCVNGNKTHEFTNICRDIDAALTWFYAQTRLWGWQNCLLYGIKWEGVYRLCAENTI